MGLLTAIRTLGINKDYPVTDAALIDDIKTGNRQALSSVPKWFSEQQLAASYFGYGAPESIRPLLNLPVGDEITYTDLILYYARKLGPVNYLELGVSVGKNFFQIASHLQNATLTGFDIENISESIAQRFQFVDETGWPTPASSIRKEASTLSRYTFHSNAISYIAADILDENSWKKLSGRQFNIIFSDALHDPKALLWEYEMIKKYQLLAPDFIFMWDDLAGGMINSFKIIANDLKAKRKFNKQNIRLIKINGWLGENSPKHNIGIVTNLQLD